MKIKLNTTRYDTRLLRRIVCAVHNGLARTEGRLPQWPGLSIEVRHGKRSYHDRSWAYGHYELTGRAWWQDISLRLPPGRVIVTDVAALVEHELLHCYGHGHDAIGAHYWKPEDWKGVPAQLGIDPVLEEAAEVKVVLTDDERAERRRAQQDERVRRLLARRKAWLTKARRAQTALAKIDRALDGYRRRGVEVPEVEAVRAAARRPRRRQRRKS